MSEIKNFFSEIFSSIPVPGFMDIVDILVVAYLLYRLIRLIRTTSAFRIAKAIIIFFVVTGLTGLLHMYTINWILRAVMEVGVVALVVMFQPELRRMLDHLGGSTLQDLISGRPSEESMAETIRAVASACGSMSRDKVGALIVFERANSLNDYFKTGTVIQADCSDALLRSIFFPNSALHDGAVILSGARIAAAGCVLPLTEKTNLSKDLGTRHRAGIGMSEANDSVVVIVSEESGTISVAEAGMLKRNLTEETLARLLTSELVTEEEKRPETVKDWINRLFLKNWKKG